MNIAVPTTVMPATFKAPYGNIPEGATVTVMFPDGAQSKGKFHPPPREGLPPWVILDHSGLPVRITAGFLVVPEAK